MRSRHGREILSQISLPRPLITTVKSRQTLSCFSMVYGAFLLNNYRESREADENKRIYFEAFLGVKYIR